MPLTPDQPNFFLHFFRAFLRLTGSLAFLAFFLHFLSCADVFAGGVGAVPLGCAGVRSNPWAIARPPAPPLMRPSTVVQPGPPDPNEPAGQCVSSTPLVMVIGSVPLTVNGCPLNGDAGFVSNARLMS